METHCFSVTIYHGATKNEKVQGVGPVQLLSLCGDYIFIFHTNCHDASVTTKNEKVQGVGPVFIMNPLKSQICFKMIYGSLLQV
ncbi:MAG: hypothetical protein HQ517_03270 [SAR324 cluster bacterium]|nr:hypothetical protein [SAR324 cluster bacterium]